MVNQNLKAGDVCLITGATRLTQNIGKTCTINCIVKHGEWFTTPEGYAGQFLVQKGEIGCVVTGEGIVKTKHQVICGAGWVIVKPHYLMKIDDPLTYKEYKTTEYFKRNVEEWLRR